MNSKMREIMEISWNEWHENFDVPEIDVNYEKGFYAACNALIPLLKQSYPHVCGSVGAAHMMQGFRPSRLPIDDLMDAINEVIE